MKFHVIRQHFGDKMYMPGDIRDASEGDVKHLIGKTLSKGAPKKKDAPKKKAVAQREDGPTVAEYVNAGYQASEYPPKGYASKSTPEEIEDAISAQEKKKAEPAPANKAEGGAPANKGG